MTKQAYRLFISTLLGATMIFLENAIHKQWHNVDRRTSGDKVIARDASRMRGRKGQREWRGRWRRSRAEL